ncbi:mannosyltransferase putative-domain-containing protein [Hyaloraphidium curvatum]|nr:mannosyltransferase putative-domain-containing protein [Hyaloraphidium curvatum]
MFLRLRTFPKLALPLRLAALAAAALLFRFGAGSLLPHSKSEPAAVSLASGPRDASCVGEDFDPYVLESVNSNLHVPERLTDLEVDRLRTKWKRHVATGLRDDAPFDPGTDGIVMSAENTEGAMSRVATIVVLLRALGCTLPVEVWFLHMYGVATDFDHEVAGNALNTELDRLQARHPGNYSLQPVFFRSFGHNESDVVNPTPRVGKKNFLVKPAALLLSKFQRPLWLDSDVLPLSNPGPVFGSQEAAVGALFWPDFWRVTSKSRVWEIFEVPCRNEWEFESGAMLVDKGNRDVRRALWLAWWMNERGYSDEPVFGINLFARSSTPRKNRPWYDIFLGDKDTFRFAFLALGVPYYLVRDMPAEAGLRGSILDLELPFTEHLRVMAGKPGFCGHSLVQFSPTDGKALFLHANFVKYSPTPGFGANCSWGDGEAPRFKHLLPWAFVRRLVRKRGYEVARNATGQWPPGRLHPSSPLMARPQFAYPAPAINVSLGDPGLKPPFSAPCTKEQATFNLCFSIEHAEGKAWKMEEVPFSDMVSKEWIEIMADLWEGTWAT